MPKPKISYANELIDYLLPMVGDFHAKMIHWLNPDDSCEDYCYDCAVKECDRLRQEDPETEVMVDGGWNTENDGPGWCCKCGVILEHSYTDEGVQEELDHWSSRGVQIETPEDAFLVLRMLGYGGNPILTESCGDYTYTYPGASAKVKRIYQRFLKHREKTLETRAAKHEGTPGLSQDSEGGGSASHS